VGKVVKFKYKQLHGLVPRDIAETMVGKRRKKDCKDYLLWEKTIGFNDGNVSIYGDEIMLVWEFI